MLDSIIYIPKYEYEEKREFPSKVLSLRLNVINTRCQILGKDKEKLNILAVCYVLHVNIEIVFPNKFEIIKS